MQIRLREYGILDFDSPDARRQPPVDTTWQQVLDNFSHTWILNLVLNNWDIDIYIADLLACLCEMSDIYLLVHRYTFAYELGIMRRLEKLLGLLVHLNNLHHW